MDLTEMERAIRNARDSVANLVFVFDALDSESRSYLESANEYDQIIIDDLALIADRLDEMLDTVKKGCF